MFLNPTTKKGWNVPKLSKSWMDFEQTSVNTGFTVRPTLYLTFNPIVFTIGYA